MPFISDDDALKLATKYFSTEEYDAFAFYMERMRHFDNCLATNTPSPHCIYDDKERNLQWCRLGLRIMDESFCSMMGELLYRRDNEITPRH